MIDNNAKPIVKKKPVKKITKVKPEGYTTGRITDKTPEVVAKLEEILRIDWTISEACSYANIDRTTYYRWLKQDNDFSNKMTDAWEYAFIQARHTINNCIKDGDWKLALDVMRRRDQRYRDKLEQEQNMNMNINIWEASDEELDKLING